MPSTINISNILLDNDLSGTLDNPYVVSISNVKFGILGVENGGLGTYSLPSGRLLLGNGILPPVFLSGSDGDFLSWSSDSSSWISKKTDNIKSLNIFLDNNQLFSLIDNSSGSTKTYNIVYNTVEKSLFLGSPENNDGTASFRAIYSSDLPDNLYNKNLFNSFLSGTFTGSIYAESLYGDGSNLYNLSSSQVNDFENRVQDILLNEELTFNNIDILTGTIQNAVINNGTFYGTVSGTLIGDGSEIENLSINSISGLYDYIETFFSGGNGVTINSGTISVDSEIVQITSSDINVNILNSGNYKIFSLNENVSINSISASTANLVNISSNNIYSNILSGNIYGNFNGIYTGPGTNIDSNSIENSSLKNNFININNNRVELGQSIQVSGISNVTSSDNKILTSLSGDTVTVNLNTVLDIPYLTTDYLSSSQIVGDGSGLTNINISNIASISNLIPVDEQNIIFNNGVLSLTESINVQNIYSPKAYIVELDVYSISGSGTGLIDIDANKLINTASLISKIASEIPASPIRNYSTTASFNVGDIVCMTTDGIQKASNLLKSTSVPIGVVSSVNNNSIFVQVNGNTFFSNSLISQTSGTIIYLGQDGDGVLYSSIPINSFVVEIGKISEQNKLEINFRKLWKLK